MIFNHILKIIFIGVFLFTSTCLKVWSKSFAPKEHVELFQKGLDAFFLGQYKQSSKYWLPLARVGDPMAARNMGILFHKGLGLRKDIDEAILYYNIAAEAGLTSAQMTLGLIYLKGTNVKRDIKKATKYLQMASDAGDMTSQYNLGLIYEFGLSVEKNKEYAWRLYHAAANAGHKKASAKIIGLPPLQEKDIKGEIINKKYDTLHRPDHSKSVHLDFETKKQIYQKGEDTDYPDKIGFLSELQDKETPPLILKEEEQSTPIYHGITPSIINPFDYTGQDNVLKDKDGNTVIDEYGYSKIYSISESSMDRSLVQANKLYKTAELLRKKARKSPDNKKVILLQDANLKENIALDIWEEVYKKNSGEAAYRLGKHYLKKIDQDRSNASMYKQKAYIYLKKGAFIGDLKSKDALEALKLTFSQSDMMSIDNISN